MAIEESGVSGGGVEDFQTALEDLVLRAFARGVTVDRSWRIDAPVADAPSWLIEISQTETDKENGYDPSLIDD